MDFRGALCVLSVRASALVSKAHDFSHPVRIKHLHGYVFTSRPEPILD